MVPHAGGVIDLTSDASEDASDDDAPQLVRPLGRTVDLNSNFRTGVDEAHGLPLTASHSQALHTDRPNSSGAASSQVQS